MASFPGWTWEYIDASMDFQRLAAMNKYWDKHPPVHIAIKRVLIYFGIDKPTSSSSGNVVTKGDQMLASMFSSSPTGAL